MMKSQAINFKLPNQDFGVSDREVSPQKTSFLRYGKNRHLFLSQVERWGEAILREKGWLRAEIFSFIRSPRQNYEKNSEIVLEGANFF
jgi:hypothetical protein